VLVLRIVRTFHATSTMHGNPTTIMCLSITDCLHVSSANGAAVAVARNDEDVLLNLVFQILLSIQQTHTCNRLIHCRVFGVQQTKGFAAIRNDGKQQQKPIGNNTNPDDKKTAGGSGRVPGGCLGCDGLRLFGGHHRRQHTATLPTTGQAWHFIAGVFLKPAPFPSTRGLSIGCPVVAFGSFSVDSFDKDVVENPC
jgi:hypothetical protein